jgi:hypothetical protein
MKRQEPPAPATIYREKSKTNNGFVQHVETYRGLHHSQVEFCGRDRLK